MDGVPQGREPFLILCHDISFPHHRVMVQIPGKVIQPPSGCRNLFQGKFKQGGIIRLKLYTSACCQYFMVTCEELPGSQPAFCMSVLWPGV